MEESRRKQVETLKKRYGDTYYSDIKQKHLKSLTSEERKQIGQRLAEARKKKQLERQPEVEERKRLYRNKF